MAQTRFQALVVGQESVPNMQLAHSLRVNLGTAAVFRFLEIRHLLEHLAGDDSLPTGIFFDLFSYPLKEATDAIGYIRSQYPKAVFALYLGQNEVERHWKSLPFNWQSRLEHYYRLFKAEDDAEQEPIVRRILQRVRYEAEQNTLNTPLALTTPKEAMSFSHHTTSTAVSATDSTLFISYARSDWTGFVSGLVNRLRDKGFDIWVDQHLIVGGSDWMDAIGEALDRCKTLILVMSPDALQSRYVKMEYRYFFMHGKPIIPLLRSSVEHIPPELSTTQFIDFSMSNLQPAFTHLFQVLESESAGG